MKSFVDFIYTVLIASAVAVFVGLGIWTFYSPPKSPTYPDYPSYNYNATPSAAEEKAYQAKMDKYNEAVKKYDDSQKSYSKRVAGIAIAGGIVAYVLGLWLIKKNWIIGEGLALGGVFTLIYAAAQAGIGDFKQLVFGSVTVLLAMLILLVFFRNRFQRIQHL